MSNKYPSGVRYEGDEGWISAGPGRLPDTGEIPPDLLDASDKTVFTSEIGANEIHLFKTDSLHGNWVDCVKTRNLTLIPAEVGHRSCSLALLGDIAMHIGRRLKYDPAKEMFLGDDEANAMLSRPQRAPYGTNTIRI